ncbi:hypothetical protein CAMGR0001_0044 [Campylobacter gracilis RM3268]|uniref:Uncharacterized protein n=1 Tax=Campylobacter gracilis RM3268 TaxID=553220 RepID=C8PI62_9BACT|nr:hypothetical protein CAMGR0001_0044 [Campylobacter gracilis RM3268]
MKFRNLKAGLCIKFHARQALCAPVRASKNRGREIGLAYRPLRLAKR